MKFSFNFSNHFTKKCWHPNKDCLYYCNLEFLYFFQILSQLSIVNHFIFKNRKGLVGNKHRIISLFLQKQNAALQNPIPFSGTSWHFKISFWRQRVSALNCLEFLFFFLFCFLLLFLQSKRKHQRNYFDIFVTYTNNSTYFDGKKFQKKSESEIESQYKPLLYWWLLW